MKNEKRCTGITVPVQQADDLNLSCAKNAPDTQPQYISQEQIAQAKVARYLGHGEGNALRAADLCNRVGYRSTRTLRAAIAQERRVFQFCHPTPGISCRMLGKKDNGRPPPFAVPCAPVRSMYFVPRLPPGSI